MTEPKPPQSSQDQLARIILVAGCGLVFVVILLLFISSRGSPDGTATPASTAPAPPVPTTEEIQAKSDALFLERQRANPAEQLTLTSSQGEIIGFGVVLLLSGRITSAAPFDIKDPTIACVIYGNSSTEIGLVTETLYEVVPANETIRFRKLNMGIVPSQMRRFICSVVGATAD